MIRCLTLLAAIACVGAAAPASAQDAVDDLFSAPRPTAAPTQPEAAKIAAQQTEQETEQETVDPEVQVTQGLNAEVDNRNRAVRQANAAAQADYERQLREHAQWLDRLEREHQAEQDAYEAERLRRQQAHEAELAAWRRRVQACRAGDLTQCERPAPR